MSAAGRGGGGGSPCGSGGGALQSATGAEGDGGASPAREVSRWSPLWGGQGRSKSPTPIEGGGSGLGALKLPQALGRHHLGCSLNFGLVRSEHTLPGLHFRGRGVVHHQRGLVT